MAQIKTETGEYEIVSKEQVTIFAKAAQEKYPHDQK